MLPNEQKKIVYSLIQGEEGAVLASGMYPGWNLTSPEPLCSWQGVLCDPQDDSVLAIELEDAALRATIPSELGKLNTLEVLVLRKNNIYGTIPLQLAELPRLEILDLSLNQITGTLPKFKSKNLKDLSLSFNQISGELGSDWPIEHERMVELDLSWNKLTGIIPSSIGSMKAVRNLRLSGNNLYGFIPTSMGELLNLERLQLDENSLLGRIPKELLSADSKLSTLNLAGNDLSGTLPEALADLAFLSDLSINGNKFTGEVPKRLCRAEINAEFYDAAEELPSGISGSKIPKEVRDYCKSIACPVGTVSNKEAWPCQPCPYNSFSPYLGTEGVCMTLDENDILQMLWSVTHGPSWSKTHNWNYDGVRKCSFTGVSCDEEGNVVSLVLSNFNLQGTIPKELSGLKHLKVLDLSDNLLSGHIPSDLRFAPLEKLDLSGNHLSGIIPPLLCRSEANKNGENGEYHCDNIICPAGTYGMAGYGECLPCFDNVPTLGRKICGSPEIPAAEKALFITLTIISILLFLLVTLFVVFNAYQRKRKRERENVEKFHELTQYEPTITKIILDEPLENGKEVPSYANSDTSGRRPSNSSIKQAAVTSKKVVEQKQDYGLKREEHKDVWLDVPRIS